MDRPNILFFFPDQMRSDWTGANPALPLRTPNLQRLQEAGTTFNNAICPSPLCAPCRASLAAGVEYHNCPVQGNETDYPLEGPSFYRLLRDGGYHVMGCGKFDLNKGSCIAGTPAWGLDGKRFLADWGFSDGVNNEGKIDGFNSGKEQAQGPYLDYLEQRGLRQSHVRDFERRRGKPLAAFAADLPEEAYCDNWIAQNGLDLLGRAPAGRPWFLQVNFTGPHSPWDVTAEMARWYQGADFPMPDGFPDGGEAAGHQGVRRNYAAMIENIDRWLGRYVDCLAQRGELQQTLIVFSSDHGEMLGDRGAWGKGKPFQASVGVPLVVAGPGLRAGASYQGPATVLDLTATFLAAAGLAVPPEMDSRSLLPLLKGEAPGDRRWVQAALGEWRLAFDGRYKLIETTGEHMFFDLEKDPLEHNNLIEEAHLAEPLRLLRQALDGQPGEGN